MSIRIEARGVGMAETQRMIEANRTTVIARMRIVPTTSETPFCDRMPRADGPPKGITIHLRPSILIATSGSRGRVRARGSCGRMPSQLRSAGEDLAALTVYDRPDFPP